jgi:membrane fusion protein (multidrug efflux system)
MEASLPNPRKKKRILWAMAFGFLAVGLILFLFWLFYFRFEESTTDAYVGGNQIVITPQIPGYIAAIYADDHDMVKEGQLLIELDPIDATLALDKAKSALAETTREVVRLFQKVGELKAAREKAKAELVRRGQDYTHRKALIDCGSISKEDLEHAEAAFVAAFAETLMVEYALREALAQIENTTVGTHPRVLAAAEEVKQSFVNLKRCTLYAPAEGQIARRMAQVGEAINPQSPLMAVIPFDEMWVEANFKEVQLKKMRLGQSVKMHSDLYGREQIFEGKVIGISAGTGSVFSVLPPQNATGNWIKIVQRLPVRVSLHPEQIKHFPLRLGLSMHVKVDLHEQTGKMVPDPVAEEPLYTTDIFEQQLDDADILVQEIIEANSSFTFPIEPQDDF